VDEGISLMGGKTKTETKIDPTVQQKQFDNYDDARSITRAPVTPYSGSLDLSQSKDAITGLMGYQPQQVSTPGNVSLEQMAHYRNPFEDSVVNASLADMNHQREITQGSQHFDPAWGGGSREAVYKAGIDSDFLRNSGLLSANLRSQGFDKAVGYGQTDLARLLEAARSNQSADLAGAGVRSSAAAQMADLQRSETGFNYAEFLRQQNDPLVKQALQNESVAGDFGSAVDDHERDSRAVRLLESRRLGCVVGRFSLRRGCVNGHLRTLADLGRPAARFLVGGSHPAAATPARAVRRHERPQDRPHRGRHGRCRRSADHAPDRRRDNSPG
jgi:hypothetical protein